MRHSDSSPSIPPRFVAFARRYHPSTCGFAPSDARCCVHGLGLGEPVPAASPTPASQRPAPMAWCDVVEPRTLRACRIALGQSQAAFAATLGASPESYRTWDAGRRATPLKILARARTLATHRDDHALLPLPVLALLIGCARQNAAGGGARRPAAGDL